MPFIEKDGFKLHYNLSGAPNLPTLVLSNSLGSNFSAWDPQMAEVEKKFRVLRYDTRGHGRSSVTPGDYSIDQLAGDVLTLLGALKIQCANFCGLSMGGMIGMSLGLNHASHLERLVLCNTGAKIGSDKGWNSRIEMIRKDGMKPVAAAVVERWFTPEFRAKSPQSVESARRMLEAAPPEGYASCCAAVRDYDVRDKLSGIHVPTLVIAGSKDSATPPADGRFIAEQIPGARYAELDAAHLSNVESAERFTAELMHFLSA